MRKRISLLIAALMLALTMSFGGAGAAFADGPPWQGNDKQFHNKCTGGEKFKHCKNA
jgi:Spy/CpxP family protein refolding chaperone